jgi:hypothetical protein
MKKPHKVQLTFARCDEQITKNYLETLKTLNIKPGPDIEDYMREVYRTKGAVIRKREGEEMIRNGKAILDEVATLYENLQEAFTDEMLLAVDKALARTNHDGSIRILTYDTVEYYIKDISSKHHVPNTSVITCMRQRSYELYKDNNGELDRVLNLLESIQDDLKGVEIK